MVETGWMSTSTSAPFDCPIVMVSPWIPWRVLCYLAPWIVLAGFPQRQRLQRRYALVIAVGVVWGGWGCFLAPIRCTGQLIQGHMSLPFVISAQWRASVFGSRRPGATSCCRWGPLIPFVGLWPLFFWQVLPRGGSGHSLYVPGRDTIHPIWLENLLIAPNWPCKFQRRIHLTFWCLRCLTVRPYKPISL